jgi:S-formylglutathione hydrolase FrmB
MSAISCSILALTVTAASDGAAPTQPTALRFEVTLARDTDPKAGEPSPPIKKPQTGRLLVVLGRQDEREPRLTVGATGMRTATILGRDVTNMEPGDTVILDASSSIFPIAHLGQLPPETYAVQALLHTHPDLNTPNAPGDLHSLVKKVRLDPAAGGTIALELSESVPEETLPADTELVKYLKIRSKLLSDFHGRPIDLRAGVILPRDFDREPDRRYPLRVHIGGYGARFTGVGHRMSGGSEFRHLWMADDTPRMILLQLDGAGPLGDPYQVNSANHGPYGDAITRELIPCVEQSFRGIGDGSARVLDGGSTGGWVALALQVFYPDFFNGAWSFCPDGVDFRSFQLVNIYEDKNAYLNPHGFERPAARDESGEVRYTMRHECGLENVLGRGDTWTMSGAQWGAWNATYGPRGLDGRPVPLWDPTTGVINREAVDHWKAYDLRMVLERNWPTLGPKLQGKLHIWVGEADDFFLNNAVHRLDDFLSRARPAYHGSIHYAPGQGHCWIGISEQEMMRQMAQRVHHPRAQDPIRSQ